MSLFENGSADPGWFAKPPAPERQTLASRPDGSRWGTDDLRLDKNQFQTWIELGRAYPPDEVIYLREQLREGRARECFAFADELLRFAFNTQMTTLREDMRGADFRFLLPRAADPDGIQQLSPGDLELAKIARDYAEDAILDHIPDFFASAVIDGEYMGISGAAPHLEHRGYKGKWSSIEEIEQVPSRNFEWDPFTTEFRVYSSFEKNTYYRVTDLMRRGALVFLEVDKARPLDQRGLLWQLAPLWCISTYMLQYWAETCQDEGKAVFAVGYPQGSPTLEKLAKQTIEKLAHDLRVAHPDSLTLQFLQTKTEGRGKEGGMHQQMIEYLDRRYGAIILGHTHATGEQVGTGSRTGSEKADKNTIQRENGILRRGCRETTKQLVMPRMVEAFGAEKAKIVCPRLYAEVAQTPDYESESRIVLNNAQAGLHLNEEQQAERQGYRLAEGRGPQMLPGERAAMNKEADAVAKDAKKAKARQDPKGPRALPPVKERA